VVGALGTNPTTYDATSAAARQIMMELGCPSTGERGVILPPVVMRAVKNSSSTYMNPQVEISKQFRTGVVGTADGALWHESPVLYRHTAGTWAGAVTVATAPVDGATTLALTCGNTDTFKKGDKFSMNAVYPVHPQTRARFNATAKTFAIVDGIVGMEGNGPIQGTPRAAGVVVAGASPVAVDATCCRIMGLDPARIGYLQLTAGVQNLGEDLIPQHGERVESVATSFAVLPELEGLRLSR
jgi:hypothetical protein